MTGLSDIRAAAARIKLMACLGAGYTRVALKGAFAADDA